MTQSIKPLRSLIYAKFNSEAELAQNLNWSRQKLNRITTGKKEPDLEEVRDLSIALETSFESMANIFLDSCHQTGN